MKEIFLLKLGEIVLKGANKRQFESRLRQNVRRRMRGYGNFDVYLMQSTLYVEPMDEECDVDGAWEACRSIFGVVSLCRSLTDSGVQFHVGWNDTDRNLCILHRIRDLDELIAVIPRILRATGVKEGASGAGLLLQSRADALCAHMVYLAHSPQNEVSDMQRYGHVTMLVCGDAASDNAVYFNEKNYQQQLTEIQI